MRGARDRQHKKRMRGDRGKDTARSRGKSSKGNQREDSAGGGFTVPGEKEEGGARGGGWGSRVGRANWRGGAKGAEEESRSLE